MNDAVVNKCGVREQETSGLLWIKDTRTTSEEKET